MTGEALHSARLDALVPGLQQERHRSTRVAHPSENGTSVRSSRRRTDRETWVRVLGIRPPRLA